MIEAIKINLEEFRQIKHAIQAFNDSGGFDRSVLAELLKDIGFKASDSVHKNKKLGNIILLLKDGKIVINACLIGNVPNLKAFVPPENSLEKIVEILIKKRQKKMDAAKTDAHYFAESVGDD